MSLLKAKWIIVLLYKAGGPYTKLAIPPHTTAHPPPLPWHSRIPLLQPTQTQTHVGTWCDLVCFLQEKLYWIEFHLYIKPWYILQTIRSRWFPVHYITVTPPPPPLFYVLHKLNCTTVWLSSHHYTTLCYITPYHTTLHHDIPPIYDGALVALDLVNGAKTGILSLINYQISPNVGWNPIIFCAEYKGSICGI